MLSGVALYSLSTLIQKSLLFSSLGDFFLKFGLYISMKNKLFLLIFIPFLSSCNNLKSATTIYPSVSWDEDYEVEHFYYEIKDYEIEWEQIFDIELNEYYVYFYSKTCGHCSELKNWIIQKRIEKRCWKNFENLAHTVVRRFRNEKNIINYCSIIG